MDVQCFAHCSLAIEPRAGGINSHGYVGGRAANEAAPERCQVASRQGCAAKGTGLCAGTGHTGVFLRNGQVGDTRSPRPATARITEKFLGSHGSGQCVLQGGYGVAKEIPKFVNGGE